MLGKAAEIVDNSERPSARRISDELQMAEQNVHRCLNYLEKQGQVETYTTEVLGRKNRMVSVKR